MSKARPTPLAVPGEFVGSYINKKDVEMRPESIRQRLFDISQSTFVSDFSCVAGTFRAEGVAFECFFILDFEENSGNIYGNSLKLFTTVL